MSEEQMKSGKQASRQVGTAGLFDDVNALVAAAKRVRDAGYQKWDCHTPYPVHGLDEAMGLKASPVPTIAITAGFIGLATAIGLQGGISVFQYPTNIGGKPLMAWPAFVPIMFELFVLFAAFGTLGSILHLGKLGRWHSPLFDSGIMKEVTSDRFCIVLEASDPRYDETEARALLEQGGCQDIRPLVELEEEDGAFI